MEDRPGTPENAASVGARLRVAREAAGLNLAEVAQRTRVPQRHLEAIETSQMAELPAPPYAVGFVKSYARLLNMPTEEIGREFRAELAAVLDRRPVTPAFEPADPARVPPRWLAVVALLIAVVIALGYGLWRNGTFGGDDAATIDALASNLSADQPAGTALPASRPGAAAQSPATASGPVVITATADTWMRVGDGDRRLYMDVLKRGDHFTVPADAQAPVLRTGAPQSLTITVGSATAPTLGPPSTLVRAASLKPADLLGQDVRPAAAAPTPAAEPDSSPSLRPQRRRHHRLPPAFANEPAPSADSPASTPPTSTAPSTPAA